MPKQLTIRGVPDDVDRRLTRLSRARGQSVNSTALQILEEAVGIHGRRQRLARYATWTTTEVKEFETGLADQRVVDDDLWT